MPRALLICFTLLFFALTACGDPDIDALGGAALDGHDAPVAAVPTVELPTCGEPGVPVITGVVADWDPERVGAVAVELHGLSCGARIDGFAFAIFDATERDITGRSWPEVEDAEVEGDGRFVVRGLAAGCADYRDATRIELSAQARVGRCGFVRSSPVSVALDRPI